MNNSFNWKYLKLFKDTSFNSISDDSSEFKNCVNSLEILFCTNEDRIKKRNRIISIIENSNRLKINLIKIEMVFLKLTFNNFS
ncbi:MAG: hypothetical protein CL851_01355 [Crocinitomicaceae bacterium]|nr:hypothetical protein [Crocinitomicaceae bacterium]